MTTKSHTEIIAVVKDDIRLHTENGVDLNPYSANRARQSWQNGFSGVAPSLLDWLDCYQRGRNTRKSRKVCPVLQPDVTPRRSPTGLFYHPHTQGG
jgi:ribosome modulation factor